MINNINKYSKNSLKEEGEKENVRNVQKIVKKCHNYSKINNSNNYHYYNQKKSIKLILIDNNVIKLIIMTITMMIIAEMIIK